MPQERRNNRIAVYFTKSELSLLESEKGRLNEDSASKVIVRICKNYFDNLENQSNSKPQPMNKEEKAMLESHERAMVEMKRDIVEFRNGMGGMDAELGSVKSQCNRIESELDEIKRLILSERNKEK
jgi:hypothetical protein